MLWFVKKFWVALVTATTLVGIYYIPIDTIGIEEASTPWRNVFLTVDQNNALWCFSILCVLYLVWIETRPFVSDFLYGRVEVKFLHVSNAVSDTVKTSAAVFTVTNLTKQTVRGLSAKFTPWRNGKSTKNEMAVRMTNAKFGTATLNPADSEGLHLAHSKSVDGPTTIMVGAIEPSENVIRAQHSQHEVIGELRVNWESGGPIIRYVKLSAGTDGFMTCNEISKKEAKALSQGSQPIRHIS